MCRWRGSPGSQSLFVQIFGDLANFNPHVHVLAADGAFLPDGTFVPLPPVPEALLVEGFRRAVLEFLVRQQALSEALRGRMFGWRQERRQGPSPSWRVFRAQPGARGQGGC